MCKVCGYPSGTGEHYCARNGVIIAVLLNNNVQCMGLS